MSLVYLMLFRDFNWPIKGSGTASRTHLTQAMMDAENGLRKDASLSSRMRFTKNMSQTTRSELENHITSLQRTTKSPNGSPCIRSSNKFFLKVFFLLFFPGWAPSICPYPYAPPSHRFRVYSQYCSSHPPRVSLAPAVCFSELYSSCFFSRFLPEDPSVPAQCRCSAAVGQGRDHKSPSEWNYTQIFWLDGLDLKSQRVKSARNDLVSAAVTV